MAAFAAGAVVVVWLGWRGSPASPASPATKINRIDVIAALALLAVLPWVVRWILGPAAGSWPARAVRAGGYMRCCRWETSCMSPIPD